MRLSALSAALEDAMPSESRNAYRTLMSSLEDIAGAIEEEKREEATLDAVLAMTDTVVKNNPDNVELQQSVATLLTQVGGTQGIEEVSTEGLVGMLTSSLSIFGRKKPRTLPEKKEYNAKHREAVAKFVAELEKTYLNQKWLDKQTFVEGMVPASDIYQHFLVNDNITTSPIWNINVAKGSLEGFCKAWAQVLKPIATKVAGIEKRVEMACANKPLDDEAALEVVRHAVEELNAIPSPVSKLPKIQTTSLGNKVPTLGKYDRIDMVPTPEPTPVKEMQALAKKDAMYAAKLLKDMLTDPDWDPSMKLLWFPWLDFKDGGRFTKWIYDADNNLYDEFYGRFYFQSDPESWTWGIMNSLNQYQVAVAVVKYFDRSIK